MNSKMAEVMMTDEILKEKFNNLMQKTLQEENDVSAKNHDFSQDNNAVVKKNKLKLYTSIKLKFFLSNIAYKSVNNNDIFDRNFCFDTCILVAKNLNPFSLGKKSTDQNKHDSIYMLWKECMPANFYRYICKQKNFSNLNRKKCAASKNS